MHHRSYELWLALLAIVLITQIYACVILGFSIPAPSDFFGHMLGVVGFLLMLMTETLYSLRKRSRSARWGRMATWLRFHIFTGLVGPYMVLLHSSWKFNGLAGVVMLLTVIIVVSGFIGRYIYTAVPRTADGVEMEASQLESQIAAAETELQRWLAGRPEAARTVAQQLASLPEVPQNELFLVLGRTFLEWGYRLQWWREKQRMDRIARAQARELEKMLSRRRALRRQISSIAMARRMLAIWHTVHIPIGIVLFTAAFIHIGAAIYYATLLR